MVCQNFNHCIRPLRRISFTVIVLLAVIGFFKTCHGIIHPKVTCTEEHMVIELDKVDPKASVYLENLKYYPELECSPTKPTDSQVVFNLSLVDVHRCGITKVSNQITGKESFYHRIIVESTKDSNKNIISAKCFKIRYDKQHNVTRRSVLPAGFHEQEDIDITTTVETNAPEPVLNVSVRQGDALVNGELNVKPGTPLTMEISLDKESSSIYGLLVSYMRVSDTKSQDEVIILNGCSLDPYLFENFNTIDGDVLKGKFRAFKFPDSTYVQFTGTVNICLDKCKGIECSNGKIGYGRKKREISSIPYDPNKVFEVTLTTFIKVDYKEDLIKNKGETIMEYKELSKDPIVTLTPGKTHNISLKEFYSVFEDNMSETHKSRQNSTNNKTSYSSSNQNSNANRALLITHYFILITVLSVIFQHNSQT